jgi:predicted alpha/beta-fold hydrolase
MEWAAQRGCRRVVLAGYSMGGNLVLKAAGEVQSHPALAGVVAVSAPIDLRESADALHHWSNRVYEWHFLRRLSARYRRKAAMFPAVFDAGRAARVQSIRDFDEYVTAPNCGFASADDYYHHAASAGVLDRIRVPALVLHALDDPFIRLTPATRALLQGNDGIRLVESARGGHCAFLEGSTPDYDGYWAERSLLHFVQSLPASNAHEEVSFC